MTFQRKTLPKALWVAVPLGTHAQITGSVLAQLSCACNEAVLQEAGQTIAQLVLEDKI